MDTVKFADTQLSPMQKAPSVFSFTLSHKKQPIYYNTFYNYFPLVKG